MNEFWTLPRTDSVFEWQRSVLGSMCAGGLNASEGDRSSNQHVSAIKRLKNRIYTDIRIQT
jgi:hypothetical protein